jgi:tRNA threonylcarbamoyl adenosine modification protein YjeE
MIAQWTRDLDEAGVVRLADLLALKIVRGDVIGLRGEVGAGKTTLARALIAALLGDRAAEVPSPTFSLSQVYETSRLTVTHFDFYRLASADEAREVGFDEALENGAAIVEWPERAPELLPGSRYEIELAETADPRHAGDRARPRPRSCQRPAYRRADGFLDGQPRWRGAHCASARRCLDRSYARLFGAGGTCC